MDEPADATCPPELVHSRAGQLFIRSRAMLGDRYVEGHVDRDRDVQLSVLELTDNDVLALSGLAADLGIADRTRLTRADPADLRSPPNSLTATASSST